MGTAEVINKLKNSNLYATCTCGEEFKLSNAILFDGTKTFPIEAVKIQNMLDYDLMERKEVLKKKKKVLLNKVQKSIKYIKRGKRTLL